MLWSSRKPYRFLLACAVLAGGLTATGRTEERVSTDGQGSIVLFPYVAVDAGRGQDTRLWIANRSNTPQLARCVYADRTGTCMTSLQRCLTKEDCPAATEPCLPAGPAPLSFTVELKSQQTRAWQAGVGLAEEAASIPAVPDLFSGTLHCVEADDAGMPVRTNALAGGAALVERRLSPNPAYDAAEYQAFAIPGLEGQTDGDDSLVLGGSTAEYAGCPRALSFDVFYDGGIEPSAASTDVWTSLVLARCDVDLRPESQDTTGRVIQISIFNEFGNRATTSASFPPGPMGPRPISGLDTNNNPTRSIFHAGAQGTLSGRMILSGTGARFLGLTIEQHRDLTDPEQHSSAFVSPVLDTEALGTDIVALEGAGPSPTPTQPFGVTPSPTRAPQSVGPEITFFGLATADNQRIPHDVRDTMGDPVYFRSPETSAGFIIVVEARVGTSGAGPGTAAVTPTPNDPSVRPFLQIQADRDLGAGSTAVCDANGVAAINPPSYDVTPSITDALFDFACRFVSTACVRGPQVKAGGAIAPYGFESPLSTTSLCIPPFGDELRFPPGDTALTVQWRDVGGNIGNRKRLIVRVQ